MSVRRISVLMFALFWALAAASMSVAQTPTQTELDRYVNTPDPTYEWKVVKTVKDKGLTTYFSSFPSRAWERTLAKLGSTELAEVRFARC